MANAAWIAGLGLAATFVTSGRCAAESLQPLTLEILVTDEVGVPADTLRQAQQEASRIFEAAGIRLAWVSGLPKAPRYLIIRFVSKPISLMSRSSDVLGTAASSNGNGATTASLFYDRIALVCGRFGLNASLMLGHVMAHEMGHLLLPPDAHTPAGLMKGGWDMHQSVLASAGRLTFAQDEASLIRARLQRATNR